MAEETNIVLKSTEPSLGDIKIAPEVIEIIVGIAANQIDGVYSMRGTIAKNLTELFGRKKSLGKGVKLDLADDQLNIDVFVYLDYGVSVPKVALMMQEKIKQQLLFMTGLEIIEVNVHVEGVIPEKEVDKLNTDDLFSEKDGEN
ncbi:MULTISPECIES: Asp23/Gls24 family envelope stress response protein [Dellaglioa]|uniref:Alkaline-shock protein n=2 Tax=Dellaglioa TaxID=2767880 RepID=A0A2C8EK35_9LACO|nr:MULTISPECIES: Asp23/Gls24 family envelope stress response protein [Dellaglioa]MCZ2491052.1 Asp23/Gls24 family envelope stress response protein [Dellaglioa carnosa]MCZ2492698.1 Asp23/Gls24 family envelope stress response protein [Dellaglioa carnosa]MCZ2494130.1 Asp23/Gls24 family envelope stress response protein [Dellaglioa carnosa]MDK1716747.1 Asp23/Gls24 family envelope stress response protein [Dellaglioa algida]MDK1718569.1 Asp23/Gls24 family envelope stress response protein [Dellaglioa a